MERGRGVRVQGLGLGLRVQGLGLGKSGLLLGNVN